jgi:hypothetical protein
MKERVFSTNTAGEHSISPIIRRKLATLELPFNNPTEMERRKNVLQSFSSEFSSPQLFTWHDKISSQRDFIFSRVIMSMSN